MASAAHASSAAAPRFCEVALPIALDQVLTYSVPPQLGDRIAVGMRVVAPLKRSMLTGYVVGLSEASVVEGVRAISALPDSEPVFSQELLDLCRWVAEYYCCSWGEALQAALPAGIRLRNVVRYRLVPEAIAAGRYTALQRQVVGALHAGGPLTRRQIEKAVGEPIGRDALSRLERRGLIQGESALDEPGVSVRTETFVQLIDEAVPDADALAALQRRAPRQAAVYLDLLYNEPECPADRLYTRHNATSATLRALEARGLVRRVEKERFRSPDVASDPAAADKHTLNAEQQAAYDAIAEALDARRFQTYLLQGITGSGKTEVYLQAIERALDAGRNAIILVPEISLTPQTVGRFKARFDARIAVLHSGLSAGERFDEWRRAKAGDVRIVVGARSAIFAPIENVGIVVVDEEHDSSYKQSDTPRYHARDVAIMRARSSDAVCVLGSATPSLETFHNATVGKSVLLRLRERATRAALPAVEIVDMRHESRELGGAVVLSRRLEEAIRDRATRGEQVLLLLNRRGFAPFVLCPSCGWVAYCENCQVTLTYHAKGGFVCCHYCNERADVPVACAECGFKPLLFLGTGTQKIEDYLLQAFPDRRIERMDADTTAGKGGHARILGRLAAREIDILIGTQMIAKGHDYPNVTLVGVINADTGLALPDLRAAENAFQLLTQVAGRAGRGDAPGEVIIQTYRPRHYAVQCAARHDYDAFFAREIEERRAAGYPPFRRIVHLSVEAEDPIQAERWAMTLDRIARSVREEMGARDIAIQGPAPATVRRVKKQYRWHLALLSRRVGALHAAARAVRKGFVAARPPEGVALKLDCDPHGMY